MKPYTVWKHNLSENKNLSEIYVTASCLDFADRSPFYEEDSTWSRGIKHPGWRTGVPGEASGGVCASFSSCAAQWSG